MAILLFLIFLIGALGENGQTPDSNVIKETVKETPHAQEYVGLYFYDSKTNCYLNGEIYIGEQLVGNTGMGAFVLSKEDYEKFWTGKITIKGKTNSCFGENANIPFTESWKMQDLDDYFKNDVTAKFGAELEF